MHRLIISFYDHFGSAHVAVKELVEKGFRQNAISLVVHQAVCDQLLAGDRADSWFFSSQPAAVELAAIGPTLVSGFLACDLTAGGTAAGSLVRALETLMVPNAEAHAYAEGVRRKGILVVVKADRTNGSRALYILDHYCPVDMDCLADEWRKAGWTGFDDTAKPLARPGFCWPNCITALPGDAFMDDGQALSWPRSIAGRKRGS